MISRTLCCWLRQMPVKLLEGILRCLGMKIMDLGEVPSINMIKATLPLFSQLQKKKSTSAITWKKLLSVLPNTDLVSGRI